MRWSFIPAAEIPDDEDEFVDWLYDWWADIDRWIRSHDMPSGLIVCSISSVPDQPARISVPLVEFRSSTEARVPPSSRVSATCRRLTSGDGG